MFSTRLRSRSEWTEAISGFIKSPLQWKETKLSDHDVEFQFSSAACEGTFHLLLMSSEQVHGVEEMKRLNNLAEQTCTKKGVVLLLQDSRDGMSSWMELQMYILHRHRTITLVPLSTAQQLVPTIEKLRSYCNAGTNYCDRGDEQVIRNGIVGKCVRGRPLTNYQTAKIMACMEGLPHLAAQVKTGEGQESICNILGKDDGLRMIAYFVDGPKPL